MCNTYVHFALLLTHARLDALYISSLQALYKVYIICFYIVIC
jgi:hypothetical protein